MKTTKTNKKDLTEGKKYTESVKQAIKKANKAAPETKKEPSKRKVGAKPTKPVTEPKPCAETKVTVQPKGNIDMKKVKGIVEELLKLDSDFGDIFEGVAILTQNLAQFMNTKGTKQVEKERQETLNILYYLLRIVAQETKVMKPLDIVSLAVDVRELSDSQKKILELNQEFIEKVVEVKKADNKDTRMKARRRGNKLLKNMRKRFWNL